MAAGDPILAADYAGIRFGTIDQIYCRLVASGVQALVAGGTALTFTAEDYDPYGMHSQVSNTSRITPPRAGMYRMSGVAFIASTANTCAAWFRKNNANNRPSGQREAPPASAGARGLVLATYTDFFNGTTDYVELVADPGGSINTNQSAQFSGMMECWYTGRLTV